jgi:hypothetical protein
MEDAPDTLNVFSVEDIAILRNGKAKKNDPPIPADLAPISGGGKRKRREKKEEDAPAFLDPIKFRYREEAVVDEPATAEEAPEPAQNPDKPGRNRRRKPRPESKPEEQKAPEQKPEEKPEGEASEAEKPKRPNNHRRRNYHHRKPKQGGQNQT